MDQLKSDTVSQEVNSVTSGKGTETSVINNSASEEQHVTPVGSILLDPRREEIPMDDPRLVPETADTNRESTNAKLLSQQQSVSDNETLIEKSENEQLQDDKGQLVEKEQENVNYHLSTESGSDAVRNPLEDLRVSTDEDWSQGAVTHEDEHKTVPNDGLCVLGDINQSTHAAIPFTKSSEVNSATNDASYVEADSSNKISGAGDDVQINVSGQLPSLKVHDDGTTIEAVLPHDQNVSGDLDNPNIQVNGKRTPVSVEERFKKEPRVEFTTGKWLYCYYTTRLFNSM